MTFIIEADVKGFKYWVKILNEWSLKYRLEGLKENATTFDTHEIATAFMVGLKSKKVELKVVKRYPLKSI